MTKVFSLLIFVISFSVTAQVGIGNTSPKSVLDIAASSSSAPVGTDGILIPRLDAIPVMDPTDDQHSMLMYLTTASGGFSPGFHYWDKNASVTGEWIPMAAEIGWELDGNSNATSGTHFLGTTTTQELDFRVNSKFIARFTEQGQFELEADEKSILIGYQAGENYDPDGTAAEQNVFIGYQAAKESTSGRDNVAIGAFSFSKNTTGNFNTSIGDETMQNSTTGNQNSAFGNDALRANTTGDRNTAVGQSSLASNNTGDNNTAIGNQALDSTTGDDNTGIGYQAGESLTSGERNTFIGYDSDTTLSSVSDAVAIGSNTVVSKDDTVAIGASASATEESAVAIGSGASSSRVSSLAIGVSSNAGANYTTALGANASATFSRGISVGYNSSVTAIDAIALGSSAVSAFQGSIAFGNGAVNSKANQLCYGGITEIDQGAAAVVNASDARFKYDVEENVSGLDFILNLRPVTYKFDIEAYNEFHNSTSNETNTEKTETGFLAQEVEEAMVHVNYDFNGVVIPEDINTDNYKVSYATFVVPLVKAVQEQQKEIDELKGLVKQLLLKTK